MKAAVLTRCRHIEIQQRPRPIPGPEDVCIRLSVAGICGSDHALYTGGIAVALPVVPGHEAIGRIAGVGHAVTGVEIGQRVTIQPNLGCGHCRWCRAGRINICPDKVRIGLDRDGVFADQVCAPASYVWPIPDDLPDRSAVMAEPLAVAVHAASLAAPQTNQRVLVLGAGVIGLLTLQLAVLAGATVTACDLAPQRLAIARKLGAANTIMPDDPAVGNTPYDLIYETCGAPSALEQAITWAAPGASIVLIGLAHHAHPLLSTPIVRKELQILGSIIYTDEFPRAIELLRQGSVHTQPLTSDPIGLDQLDHALQHFSAPDRIKTLVHLSDV